MNDVANEFSRIDKSEAWQMAMGLLRMEGLTASQFLRETATRHIRGLVATSDLLDQVRLFHTNGEAFDFRDADLVTVQTVLVLAQPTFHFSPVAWRHVHARLFEDVIHDAGRYRTHNHGKKEWILRGQSVTFADHGDVAALLDEAFQAQRERSFKGLSMSGCVRHIARLAAELWQIHPFALGNTRSLAVFLIRYFDTLGFEVNPEAFEQQADYFRNALVRANYSDVRSGVFATTEYLEAFFANLVLGQEERLVSRDLHIDVEIERQQCRWIEDGLSVEAQAVSLSRAEREILDLIETYPMITQAQMAEKTEKSVRTVQRVIKTLEAKAKVRREGGKRRGHWSLCH